MSAICYLKKRRLIIRYLLHYATCRRVILHLFESFCKKWKTLAAVSTTDGWLKLNLKLQAAWYVRHAHWARLCYNPFAIKNWKTTAVSTTDWMVETHHQTRSLVGRAFSWKKKKSCIRDGQSCRKIRKNGKMMLILVVVNGVCTSS